MDYLDHLGRSLDLRKRYENIHSLEITLDLKLPMSLKIFYLMYQVNDLGKYKNLSHLYFNLTVYDDLRNQNFPIAALKSKYSDFGYNPNIFYEFDALKNAIRDFFNDDFVDYENDFLVIGETIWGFPLMIGINAENLDKTFVYDMDIQKMVFIADNIFEYLMSVELDFSQFGKIVIGKKVEDLYKNWGEDFWRVRE